jgi:selenocysteine lyase/cysteine desulfurase
MMGCVRLSHAVYNTAAEFEALRDAVMELTEEEEKGKGK